MDVTLYRKVIEELDAFGGLNINDRYLRHLKRRFPGIEERNLDGILELWYRRKVMKNTCKIKNLDLYDMYKELRKQGCENGCMMLAEKFQFPPGMIAKYVLSDYFCEMEEEAYKIDSMVRLMGGWSEGEAVEFVLDIVSVAEEAAEMKAKGECSQAVISLLESTEECAGSLESTEECAGSLEWTEECAGSLESTEECAGSLESTEECAGSLESTEECAGSLESTEECAGSSESTEECAGSSESTEECSESSELMEECAENAKCLNFIKEVSDRFTFCGYMIKQLFNHRLKRAQMNVEVFKDELGDIFVYHAKRSTFASGRDTFLMKPFLLDKIDWMETKMGWNKEGDVSKRDKGDLKRFSANKFEGGENSDNDLGKEAENASKLEVCGNSIHVMEKMEEWPQLGKKRTNTKRRQAVKISSCQIERGWTEFEKTGMNNVMKDDPENVLWKRMAGDAASYASVSMTAGTVKKRIPFKTLNAGREENGFLQREVDRGNGSSEFVKLDSEIGGDSRAELKSKEVEPRSKMDANSKVKQHSKKVGMNPNMVLKGKVAPKSAELRTKLKSPKEVNSKESHTDSMGNDVDEGNFESKRKPIKILTGAEAHAMLSETGKWDGEEEIEKSGDKSEDDNAGFFERPPFLKDVPLKVLPVKEARELSEKSMRTRGDERKQRRWMMEHASWIARRSCPDEYCPCGCSWSGTRNFLRNMLNEENNVREDRSRSSSPEDERAKNNFAIPMVERIPVGNLKELTEAFLERACLGESKGKSCREVWREITRLGRLEGKGSVVRKDTNWKNRTSRIDGKSGLKTKIIKEFLVQPSLIKDPILAKDVSECVYRDNLYGIMAETARRARGARYERYLRDFTVKAGLPSWDENSLRREMAENTPDLLLAVPVLVGGFPVNWVDSKALFADADLHKEYKLSQFNKYCNRFGTGMVIYWWGHTTDIPETYLETKLILVRLALPDLNEIKCLR